MKEQSQIEEMRAAVRGDRERAEQARQRSLENVRPPVDRAPPRAVSPPPPPEAEPGPEPAPERRRGLFAFLRRR